MRGASRSLLVTDIVGSTRLWAEHEAAMAVDLASHDEIVNGAIAAAGGGVFKHTGDGVMATFESAADSAGAASEIQRAIGVHDWQVPDGVRVRVALHSGAVHERGGDLFGPTVNRLARLLPRCSPGGVLVSDATAMLLSDSMPGTLGLRELGRIELRDVGASEAVYCLVAEHLAAVDVRDVVGTASPHAGSFPRVDDDLVGRSAEIGAVLDAIAAHPVVSIVGPGGIGKTRIALEVADAADLVDGAWWCDLAAATHPDAVPPTLLAAIGGHQPAARSVVDSIVDHLAEKRAVIVFDNCEHVLDAARNLVSAIRAGCAGVRILTTSREALGLRGERVVSLSSLPSDDAIGLFCTRATEARTELVFDEATLTAIDDICTRLDGIPLAIELAAARCRSMRPDEIAARLDDRFRLLRGGRGAERHRTLQAAIDWSYTALEDDERDLFDRMAVLAGGGLIDAISAIFGHDEYDTLDTVDRLIARSMVVAFDTPLGTRYRQLETLRQFAEDRLVEHGRADEIRDRHLTWARTLASWLHDAELTDAETGALRRYVVEIDNLRAAVHYAVGSDRHLEACDIIAGIAFHATCRPTYEIIDWVDPASVSLPNWTEEVASTAGVFADLSFFAGDANRTVELLAMVPERHEHNRWVIIASTYRSVFVDAEYEKAERFLADVVPVDDIHAFGRDHSMTLVFQWRLFTDRSTDADYARAALSYCDAFAARTRALDAPASLAVALFAYGFCLDAAGQHARAIAMHSESLELSEAVGAGLLADAAGAGLVDALVRLAAADGANLRDSVSALRTAIEATLKRHTYAFLKAFMAHAVERVLWAAGDHRTAALLSQFGRMDSPISVGVPTVVDATLFDADTIAGINAEAAQLDPETAATIALAALDQILANHT